MAPPSFLPCLPSGFSTPEAFGVCSEPAPALGGDSHLLTDLGKDLESLRSTQVHQEALTPGYCLEAEWQGCPPPGALGICGRGGEDLGLGPSEHGSTWRRLG